MILIKNGKIRELIPRLKLPKISENMLDVGELIVLPGLVDTHVHVNEPGREDWEGFESATKAALAGGITTILDMPLNSIPVTTNLIAFEKKLEIAKPKIWTDTGFIGGLVPHNISKLKDLRDGGVFGFKSFLTHSGIDDFPNMTREDLKKSIPLLSKLRIPLMLHAELDVDLELINTSREYTDFLQSRPDLMEYNAIEMLINEMKGTNIAIHIVHLSSGTTLQLINEGKASNALTVETCPHYLYFNDSEIKDGQTQFKCMPPIRGQQNQELLWGAIKDGLIDCIVSDHSPCTPDLKNLDKGDFMNSWGGIASIQFTLSAIHTKSIERGVDIQTITKLMSTNPANIFSIPDKGKISIGYDADFAIFDPQAVFTVTENVVLHKNKLTPYLGEKLVGKVIQTILRGEIVYENDEVVKLPRGKILLKSR